MGSKPDLLVTLFENCRHLTTLNLWNTYVEVRGEITKKRAARDALVNNS